MVKSNHESQTRCLGLNVIVHSLICSLHSGGTMIAHAATTIVRKPCLGLLWVIVIRLSLELMVDLSMQDCLFLLRSIGRSFAASVWLRYQRMLSDAVGVRHSHRVEFDFRVLSRQSKMT